MGILRLPKSLRTELSKPFGTLLKGDPDSNTRDVLELITKSKPPKVVVVGDFTLKRFFDHNFQPSIGIFDRRTRRSSFSMSRIPNIVVRNPSGSITDESVEAIRIALSSQEPILIMVDGEEDLLSLPAIAYSPMGSLVIYGLPDEGMIVIKVDHKIREKILGLLSRFERTD